ncbi:putative ubiquitin-protein ligase [Trypanosoma vivax]|nr:putative ubiquitin-protein ligase [Trypanosoma vivax]
MSQIYRPPVEDSKQQIKAVQQHSDDPKKVVLPLETMCMSLVMGVEQYLRSFDSTKIVPILVHMVERQRFTHHGDSLTMIFRAVSLIMEHVPTSYNVVQPYHKRLVRSVTQALSYALQGNMNYESTLSETLLEEALRLLRFITKDEYGVSLVCFGMNELVRVAASENMLLARHAIDVLLLVCSKIVLPHDKRRSSFLGLPSFLSCTTLVTGVKTHGSTADVKPSVFVVEHIIAPFLHSTIRQYALSVESYPEVWSFLEIALQCLGMLVRRAIFFQCTSIIPKLVNGDLCRTLYRLLLFNERNVALEPAVRSERLLFCETMLDIVLLADWTLGSAALLSEDALSFYNITLDDSDAEIMQVLNDPFPTGGAARGTHRRDKNHIVSIAAIRHFILACPAVPSMAFGPKPKVLLPVHQWAWEDETRHHNNIAEERCVELEINLARRRKEVPLTMHSQLVSVNLQVMKMYIGLSPIDRNICRKFIPFVFHFVNEADIQPPSESKVSLAVNKYAELHCGDSRRQARLSSSDRALISSLRSLQIFNVMNVGVSVPPTYMRIAELYLGSLCKYATWASGSMAIQLGVCACASLLHAAILCKRRQQLGALMQKSMRPLCDVLRGALTSADKSTKSLALTMMVWLLCHPQASEWRFAETVQRCGVMGPLKSLASSYSAQNGECDTLSKVQKFGTKSRKAKSGWMRGKQRSRTEHLASLAFVLHYTITEQLNSATAQLARSLSSVDITVVGRVVNELREAAAVPGEHKELLSRVLEAMEKSFGAVTAFEISEVGIADAVLSYLLGGRRARVVKKGKMSDQGAASCEEDPTAENDVVLDLSPDSAVFGGTHAVSQLHRHCKKNRLRCLLDCAADCPRGMTALIENLVSAMFFYNNLPLVESLTGSCCVTCLTPSKAVAVAGQLSPYVRLCAKAHGRNPESDSDFLPANENEKRLNSNALQNKDADNGASLQPPTVEAANSTSSCCYCPNGHPLLPLVVSGRNHACEWCGTELLLGYSCELCKFDVCNDCCNNMSGLQECKSPLCNPLSDERRTSEVTKEPGRQGRQQGGLFFAVRAHLFSSVGDIERTFRTGSNSTKDTEIGPCPRSATTNVDALVNRVQLFLSRKKEKLDGSTLLQEVRRVLASFESRDSCVDETNSTVQEPCSPSSEREKVMHRLLREAMEDRHVLYTTSTGRCALQETLIGNLMLRALNEGALGVVEQLEECLITTESYKGPPTKNTGEGREERLIEMPSKELPTPYQASCEIPQQIRNTQTYIFHHFESDEHSHCCCGRRSRRELNTVNSPRLVRSPPQIAQSKDALLLLLLHKALQPLMKSDAADIEASSFISTPLTTHLVKSVAASALRVALLPPRLAVPRWVYFILTAARFLIPPNVREHVSRFLAYGARRAFDQNVRKMRVSRAFHFMKVFPAEWSALANHKYIVDRNDLLNDAYIVFQKSAEFSLPISVQFKGDVGVGLGPTAHFYTLIAKELLTSQLMLWHSSVSNRTTSGGIEHNIGCKKKSGTAKDTKGTDTAVETLPEGLYPAPAKQGKRFSLAPTSQGKLPNCVSVLVERFPHLGCFHDSDQQRAHMYYLVGAVLGRAFTDGVVFPLDLSPAIALFLCRGVPPACAVLHGDTGDDVDPPPERPIDLMSLDLDDLELMDHRMAASLRSLLSMDDAALSSLELHFTMPGSETFEMVDGGAKMRVSAKNVGLYCRRAASSMLYESVVMPIRLMAYGFRDVVPHEALVGLSPCEAMNVLCGSNRNVSEPLWSLSEIRSILVADHGYNNDSPQITMLQNVLAIRFTPQEQRNFLLFCTGCPRLPRGGLNALGAITVVKRSVTPFNAGINEPFSTGSSRRNSLRYTDEELATMDSRELLNATYVNMMRESDWPLPSVNTCFRYLKLPPYPTEELMCEKLRLSIAHGGDTFELS